MQTSTIKPQLLAVVNPWDTEPNRFDWLQPILTLTELTDTWPSLFGGSKWRPPSRRTIRRTKLTPLPATMEQTAQPFPHTLGVELTWTAPFPVKYSGEHATDYYHMELYHRRTVNALVENMPDDIRARYWRIDTDCGCVEIPTNPCSDYATFSASAGYLDKVIRSAGLSHTSQHTAGGGAHIHVGLSNFGYSADMFTQTTLADMLYRPYISRAFSYFADSRNARPMQWADANIYGTQAKPKSLLDIQGRMDCAGNCRILRTSYHGGGTLEFRCFQAPKQVKDYELYISFVIAYCAMIEKRIADNDYSLPVYERDLPTGSRTTDNDWQYDTKRFLEFIAALGLPVKRYRKFAKNIQHRAWYAGNCGSNYGFTY